MEVVGAVAGVVALAALVKDLVELGQKLKDSLGKISTNSADLQELASNIVEFLHLLEGFVNDNQTEVDPPGLQDSLFDFQADLQQAFAKCQRLSKRKSRFGKVGVAFRNWTQGNEIQADIARIEKRIKACYLRFSTSGSVRVENELSRLHLRFGHLEASIERVIKEAEDDPGKAQDLIGTQYMSRPAMHQAREQATLALSSNGFSSLENQYLRTLVNTLTHAISNTTRSADWDHEIPDLSPLPDAPSPTAYRTHFSNTDDPSQERQDAVMETLRVLAFLRDHGAVMPLAVLVLDMESLSRALLDLAMYEDALEMYSVVAKMCRKSSSDRHAGKLALALVGISVCSRQLGEYQEALKAVEEAVVILRQQEHSSDFRHHLSLALCNVANYLRYERHYEDAWEAAGEAVDIRRSLAKELPDVYDPDLAISLLTASSCLSKLGPEHQHETIEMVNEAVKINRRLAEDRPELFRPHLAASLHNTAIRLQECGSTERALHTALEAVAIRRTLASDRPDVYNLGFARSLTVAATLSRRDKISPYRYPNNIDYLELWREAVNVLRTHLGHRLPLEGRLLLNFGGFSDVAHFSKHVRVTSCHDNITSADRFVCNVEACLEGLSLFRLVSDSKPLLLATSMSLSRVFLPLKHIGVTPTAIHVDATLLHCHPYIMKSNRRIVTQALDIFAIFFEDLPEVMLPRLGSLLAEASWSLAHCGLNQQALKSLQIALELYMCLPDSPLVHSLPTIPAIPCDATLKELEADAGAQRILVRKQLNGSFPVLARSLTKYALYLKYLERYNEAWKILEEVEAIWLEVTQYTPTYSPDLATLYYHLSCLLGQQGQLKEAVDVAQKGLLLWAKIITKEYGKERKPRHTYQCGVSTAVYAIWR